MIAIVVGRDKRTKGQGKGSNPVSKKNLLLGGESRRLYDEAKHRRGTYTTNAAWDGINEVAREHGLSIAELFEQIGRRKLLVVQPESAATDLPPVEGEQAKDSQDSQE